MSSPSILIIVATWGLLAEPQRNFASQDSAPHTGNRLKEISHSSSSYREKAIELVVSEANQVASELHLHEQLPITKSNILYSYISPPPLAKGMGTFGNITTSNYTYYISVSNKFSFLTKRNLESDYEKLRKDYLLPRSELNTNSAVKTALESLAACEMDAERISRECQVEVRAFTPEGREGPNFVPVYWITWFKKEHGERSGVASIELFEPTKEIRQLRVLQSDYIKRKAIVIHEETDTVEPGAH